MFKYKWQMSLFIVLLFIALGTGYLMGQQKEKITVVQGKNTVLSAFDENGEYFEYRLENYTVHGGEIELDWIVSKKT